MALIAFLHFNIGIGTIWGSFSVLLGAVEARFGIDRTASTMGVPLVTLVSAALSPVFGGMLRRHSLRTMALLGSACTFAGFASLALSSSYTIYLLAFALLLGPGQAIAVIVPATLVTRWYGANRGRALGFVCSPILVALVPLLSSGILQRFGLTATYAVLAFLGAVTLVANLLIVNQPPTGASAVADGEASTPPMSMRSILRQPVLWCFLAAFIPLTTGAIILSAHMVPIAQSWGLSATAAATLLSVQSVAGIAGTLLFGWLADRIGGARTMALMAFGCALLWACLLVSPSFAPAVLVIALIGLHNAGVAPVTSHTLAERMDSANFSTAFGVVNLLILPFTVMGPAVAALVFAQSGAYTGVVVGQIVLYLLGIPFTLVTARVVLHPTR